MASSFGEQTEESVARHQARRERYTLAAAERVGAAEECQFSLLPFPELQRAAGLWYDAAHEAMLRANYGPLDSMIRHHVRLASEQGFELGDILQLLRLFREVAITNEGWNEEQFGELDEVIDEALQGLHGQVAWSIPAGLNYLTGRSLAEPSVAAAAEEAGDRRVHTRNKLRLPIRVKTYLPVGALDEITRTENVARSGLYFVSKNPYRKDVRVHVMYPYWDTPNAINPEYAAEVVRLDDRPDEYMGVALRFLTSLGRPKSPS